jgi:phosphosulfolactate synthase
MPGPDFLALPARAAKPRATGITHVLDRGLPLAQSADLLAANGPYVDVWKLGWGISYLDPNLTAKLELLADHRVLASPGGTLLEIAWAQGRAAGFLDWARACGFPCVEVSAGTVAMDDAAKGPHCRGRPGISSCSPRWARKTRACI